MFALAQDQQYFKQSLDLKIVKILDDLYNWCFVLNFVLCVYLT